MWIVTQDRKACINCIGFSQVSGPFSVKIFGWTNARAHSDDNILLGEYVSEWEANKEMDNMILVLRDGLGKVYYMTSKGGWQLTSCENCGVVLDRLGDEIYKVRERVFCSKKCAGGFYKTYYDLLAESTEEAGE